MIREPQRRPDTPRRSSCPTEADLLTAMRQVALLAVVVIAAAAVRVARLDVPARMVFDEIYYAKAARQYLQGQEITEEITHPPLSKLIIALGIRLAGDRPLGWRIAGALAGGLLVLLCALLVAEVLRAPFATLAGALLLAVDLGTDGAGAALFQGKNPLESFSLKVIKIDELYSSPP